MLDIKHYMNLFFDVVFSNGNFVYVASHGPGHIANPMKGHYNENTASLHNVYDKLICGTKTEVWDILYNRKMDDNTFLKEDCLLSFDKLYSLSSISICIFPDFKKLMMEMYPADTNSMSCLYHECDDDTYAYFLHSWMHYMSEVDLLGRQTLSTTVEECSNLNWFYNDTELMNVFSIRYYFNILQMVNAGMIEKTNIDRFLEKLNDKNLNDRFKQSAKKFIEQGVGERELHKSIDGFVKRFEDEILFPTEMFDSNKERYLLCSETRFLTDQPKRIFGTKFNSVSSYGTYSETAYDRMHFNFIHDTLVVSWKYKGGKLIKQKLKELIDNAYNFISLNTRQFDDSWSKDDVGYFDSYAYESSKSVIGYARSSELNCTQTMASIAYVNDISANHEHTKEFCIFTPNGLLSDEKYERKNNTALKKFLSRTDSEFTFMLILPVAWHALGKSRIDLDSYLPTM